MGNKHSDATSTPKKVAIVCLSRGRGGMELDAIRLQRRLSHIADAWLICREGGYIAQAQTTVCRGGDDRIVAIKHWGTFSPSLIFALRKILTVHRISNLIFFGASEIKSIKFAIMGLGINFIIRHPTTKSTSKKDFVHRFLYSSVSHVVAVSRHLLSNAQAILPIPPGAGIRVIYPAVSIDCTTWREKKSNTSKGVVRILHVGTLTEGKGQIDAVRACGCLYRHGIPFELRLAGEGNSKFKSRLRKIISGTPYWRAVKLVGYVRCIEKEFAGADVFLFPTKGEGFGNVLVEALACGLVCIAYSNTSIPEILTDGIYGHAVKDGCMSSIEATLLDVCRCLGVQKKRSMGNISLVKERFSEAREIAAYDEILI